MKLIFINFTIFLVSCSATESEHSTSFNASNSKYNERSLFLVDSLVLNFNNLEGNFTFSSNNKFILSRNPLNDDVFLIKNFQTIQKINKKGRGPDELMDSFTTGFDLNDNIIIFDQALNQIKTFDIFGNFINTYSLKSETIWFRQKIGLFDTLNFTIGMIEAENSHPDLVDKSKTIGIFRNGILINSFGHFKGKRISESEVALSVISNTYANKNIFIQSYRKDYLIEIFNSKTQSLESTIDIRPKYFTFSKNPSKLSDDYYTRRKKSVDQSLIEAVYYANDTVYLFYVKFTMESHITMTLKGAQFSLFAYDMKNREVIFDDHIDEWPAGVDHDGYVYTIDDKPDYQIIKKYAL